MLRCRLALLIGLFALALPAPLRAQTAKPSSPPPYEQLTPADFGRIPLIEQPQLSPDGRTIAGLMRSDGKQTIAVLDLFNPNAKPMTFRLGEESQASWIRWVNNDNLVVGLYALLPVDGGDHWHISRLIAINKPTGRLTKVLWESKGQNAADVLWIASDGSPTILVAAQDSIYSNYEEFWPTVWRINVENGKRDRTLKGRLGIMDWFADSAGNVRAGVSFQSNTRRFRMHYRDPDQNFFRQVDSADTRKQEQLIQPFLFVPGTTRALAIQADEKDRAVVVEIDMPTQQTVRTVYAAPDDGQVENVMLSADGANLLGARITGPVNRTVWFDPVLAETQAAIDKAVPGRRARIVSMNAARSRLLVHIDRPNSPGTLYYYDLNVGKLQMIALINERLGSRALAPTKMVQYKARDGLQIEAVLTLPPGRTAKNLPIVVMPHGGPWAHDTLDYDYWAQFIASRGYAVIQPNFRGSTGYGAAFLRAGEGQMGFAMQDDVSDALAWAAKEGIADPKRSCIVGASYGGYAAMWGIAKDPDLYRCAVSVAGVSNLRREVNDFRSALLSAKYRDDWQRMTPDFAAVSPINAVGRIKAPLLLIHGKRDITVDSVQSISMAAKMRGAGKSAELLILPEADHYFTREADRVELLTAIEVFLRKHNPPDPPAPAAASAQ